MCGLRRITNDLYDIAWRLKEIDERYELFYNGRQKRFEIHADGALQTVVPFPYLDARTLIHARKTRVENLQRLIEEIEANNRRAEEEKRRDVIEKALAAADL